MGLKVISIVAVCFTINISCQAQTQPATQPPAKPTTSSAVTREHANAWQKEYRETVKAAAAGDWRTLEKLLTPESIERNPLMRPHRVRLDVMEKSPEAHMVKFLVEKYGALDELPAEIPRSMLLYRGVMLGRHDLCEYFWECGIRAHPLTAAMNVRDWKDVHSAGSSGLNHFTAIYDSGPYVLLKRYGFPLSVYQAAAWGDVDTMAELIAAGADIHSPPDATPLVYAAIGGNLAVAQQLLDAGAKLDPVKQFDPTDSGFVQPGTPLQEAAIAGKSKMVRFLLSKGADASLTYRHYTSGTVADYIRGRMKNEPKSAMPEWQEILKLLDEAGK